MLAREPFPALLTGLLHQIDNVEDKSDTAVSEDGGPGDALHIAIHGTEGLDDGLVFTDDIVNNEAKLLAVDLGDDNLLDGGRVAVDIEFFA